MATFDAVRKIKLQLTFVIELGFIISPREIGFHLATRAAVKEIGSLVS